ncbi:hypothetical protein EB810_14955 [Altererythrobacter sp. FM1]|uniref:hypothetical protein n=1 Tax=Tsuneonella flava TaxID=2055955 RepID=UPI000C802B47|nr:hypothetical protein [Tsuneonella flava]ROT93390.1 hypothetical protein EB810_14955 [Altererythrobacter sp. FM1]
MPDSKTGQPETEEAEEAVPLGGTRAEAVQRLQVGVSLLVGVLLLVGIANVIENRAQEVEATTVPEAAATVPATPSTPQNDPLADAGVVPDIPADDGTTATPAPTASPAMDAPVPGTGN